MNRHTKIQKLREYLESVNYYISVDELNKLQEEYPYVTLTSDVYFGTICSDPKLNRFDCIVHMSVD